MSQGYSVKDANPSTDYIESIDQMAKQKNPFAMSIVNSCTIFDESGLTREGVRWEAYVANLKKFVEMGASSGQSDLDAQKQNARLCIEDITGGSEAWSQFQDAYREMDKYRAMVAKRSEDTARTIAYSIFKAKNDAVTKEKLNYQLETYLRDAEGNFIHPNAVRYFLYQTFELLKAEKKMIDKKLRDAEKFFDEFNNVFDDPKTDDEESVDQLAAFVK